MDNLPHYNQRSIQSHPVYHFPVINILKLSPFPNTYLMIQPSHALPGCSTSKMYTMPNDYHPPCPKGNRNSTTSLLPLIGSLKPDASANPTSTLEDTQDVRSDVHRCDMCNLTVSLRFAKLLGEDPELHSGALTQDSPNLGYLAEQLLWSRIIAIASGLQAKYANEIYENATTQARDQETYIHSLIHANKPRRTQWNQLLEPARKAVFLGFNRLHKLFSVDLTLLGTLNMTPDTIFPHVMSTLDGIDN
ncbi:hypothetical protein FA15DRAFT_708052 [Coprinopsis marcescibilis]|uniref:Uncharacterized protein n=1 Tax=Coprinopsis marcescibilis TaxID=230819 RepID=A0A5C3KK10_COPMA|nr:hypothetical protein FA15DRAFT_708052 [Coprinopsis marcescibilis]